MYVYIYIYVCICIFVYIYIEREREIKTSHVIVRRYSYHSTSYHIMLCYIATYSWTRRYPIFLNINCTVRPDLKESC